MRWNGTRNMFGIGLPSLKDLALARRGCFHFPTILEIAGMKEGLAREWIAQISSRSTPLCLRLSMLVETPTAPVSASTVRMKIAWRILPFVFVLYIVSYLDRANVAFAKIPMSEELHFSEAVFGFGAGIFFVGYLLLEIPGALLVEHWSARKWIARILVTWGFCTIGIGFIQTPRGFYWARFFLGLAEAGFFPGVIIYLTHWFSARDRARAMSGFTMAVPLSLAMGAQLSAAILQVDWFGLAGWRWMFILEGLPAVVLGVGAWFYLTDRPENARWLEPAERDWINRQLRMENERKRAEGKAAFRDSLRDPNVILLALGLFFVVLGGYGFLFWLPSTIKEASGLSVVQSTVLASLPFGLAFFAIAVFGWSSDRANERKLHAAVPMALAGVFLWLSTLPGQSLFWLLVWLSLTGAAAYAWAPAFWALPTLLLGESAAAVSVGIINCVGSLGGFVGPFAVGYLLNQGYPKVVVLSFLQVSFLLAALLLCLTRPPQTEMKAL